MSLPTNVGFGTVVGRFIDFLGNPIAGKVTFTPTPVKLLNVSATPSPVTILPKPVVATLDTGAFSQSLVATDDPDNNPSSWTYTVSFDFVGASLASYSITVPEGQTVDLTVVAPVPNDSGVWIPGGPMTLTEDPAHPGFYLIGA